MLQIVDRPSAKELIPFLDMNNPLGIKKADASTPAAKKGAGVTKVPLYSFFMEMKAKHPTKVLLVRVRQMSFEFG